MNDLERLSVDDLTEDEIEAVLNTRGFRKMLAYQRLAGGYSGSRGRGRDLRLPRKRYPETA